MNLRPLPRASRLSCNLIHSCAAAPTPRTHTIRTLSSTPTLPKKSSQLPPRPSLPDSDLRHVYLKGSGPGGQKINKTSSAVQLTHIPTGIVVKSQATRSQSQNHTIARRILAEKIELLEKGGESRAAKVVERKRRRKASAAKKARRKYRKLEGEEKEGEGGEMAAAAVVVGAAGVRTRFGSGDEEWEDVDDVEDADEEFEDDEDSIDVVESGDESSGSDAELEEPARPGTER